MIEPSDTSASSRRDEAGSSIKDHLHHIQQLIQTYAERYHREPNRIQLLAVSKAQSIENVQQAIMAGVTAFGENYLQEALTKIEAINNPSITWHFIGPIQSNKTKKIAEHFAWVHSVSDIAIATRLNNQRPDALPPLNICLQVNSGGEKTKSGVEPQNLLALATACLTLPRLQLRGIMAIPAPKNNLADQRAECHKIAVFLQNLREKGIKLDTLSMGMTHDLEAAIAEGSTMVRIGAGIFGQRQ